MMVVEAPTRVPAPDWAVWSFMLGLYSAVGSSTGAEAALYQLISAVVLGYETRNTAHASRTGDGS